MPAGAATPGAPPPSGADPAAVFLGSFPDPLQPLHPRAPEFALIGRSNVGKSSLVNALTGLRSLARVSGTPGKTALLNVYRLPSCYLLDLPGYGYARAALSTRQQHRRLIDDVIMRRDTLTGIVWLLDARHEPSRLDRDIRRLLGHAGRPLIAVLTKADQVPRREYRAVLAARAADLALAADQVQLVSARSGFGIPELRDALSAGREEEP